MEEVHEYDYLKCLIKACELAIAYAVAFEDFLVTFSIIKEALRNQNARIQHVENCDKNVVSHFGLSHSFVTATAKHRLHGKAAQLNDRINKIDPQYDSIERVENASFTQAVP